MYTCVLNAAEGRLHIVLGHTDMTSGDAHIVCAQDWHAPTRGTEILAPALEHMLHALHLVPSDIQRFACIHGPGSFTGIRLILSTVAAMRRITKAQNAALDYMHVLATSALEILPLQQDIAHIWVLTHARRGLVHAQCFKHIPHKNAPNPLDSIQALQPVALYSLEVLQNIFMQTKMPTFICGSGFTKNKEFFTTCTAQQPHIKILNCQEPSMNALWQWARCANYHDADIEPVYVRPCDAVENLDHIAKKQGMQPEKAHARLEELLHSEGKIL